MLSNVSIVTHPTVCPRTGAASTPLNPSLSLSPGPGGLPGEHPTDHAGDPQRGRGERSPHDQRGGNAELVRVHDVRSLGDPVPTAELPPAARAPEHRPHGHAEEESTAPPFVSTENQNPRPDGRERHRQMVADHFPCRVLPL